MIVKIFTDGSCWPNPGGPGGAAAILMAGAERREVSRGFRASTNNRMEVMAAIIALEALNRPCEVVLTSDSEYVVFGINDRLAGWRKNGWRSKPTSRSLIANHDLWARLHALTERHWVEALWVKGHKGHEHNERCDIIAGQAAKLGPWWGDDGYTGEIHAKNPLK